MVLPLALVQSCIEEQYYSCHRPRAVADSMDHFHARSGLMGDCRSVTEGKMLTGCVVRLHKRLAA